MVAKNEAVLNGIVRPLEVRVLPHRLIINPEIKTAGLEMIVADNRKRAVADGQNNDPKDDDAFHQIIVARSTPLSQKCGLASPNFV